MHTKVSVYNKGFSGFVSLIWLTGSLIGLAVAFHFSILTTPMIQNTYFEDLSFWGYFVSGALPLALTYLFIRSQWMPGLYVLFFVKAFLYGFSFFSVAFAYQQAAWLAMGISFLSQSCCCMLMFFLFLSASANRFLFKKSSIFIFSAYTAICALEHLILRFVN